MPRVDGPNDAATLRALLPGILLALAGGCAASVALAFGMALAGLGAPSVPVLLLPPGLALAGCCVVVLRKLGPR